MQEEAVEVLHNEAECVIRDDGVLETGNLLVVYFANDFREILVVADEVERSQFINITIQNKVNQAGEVLLLTTFIVNHNRLEERVILVEWQEPVSYAMQVFAMVQQDSL